MFEIELKFEVPGAGKAALLAALRRGKVTEQRLQASYFDTPGDLLARHRMALRLRKEGPRWVQTLKASTADSMRRLEHEVVVVGGTRGQTPALDRALHDGTPAGEELKGLLPQGVGLEVRYSTDVRRISRMIRAGRASVEVAFDVGWIVAGADRVHVCEIEFELKRGPVDDLILLAERWVAAHGLWLNTVSKAERGTRLSHGERHGPAIKAQAMRLPSKISPPAALRAVVANSLDQITANASEVAAGSIDEDHVHQLRVGIRRLRTALRELAGFGAGIEPDWEVELRKAFGELGVFRDREAVLQAIEPQIKAAGAPSRLGATMGSTPLPAAGSADSGPSPAETVGAAAFQKTLLALLRFSVSSPEPADAASPRDIDGATAPSSNTRQLFATRLNKLHRRVDVDGAIFTTLPPELQHRVRKRLKRLRYVAEFAEPLFERKRVARYLESLRPAQDELGIHNDQIVALVAYKRDAAIDPHASFAAGWLTAKQTDSAVRCQRALERVARASRFWKKKD